MALELSTIKAAFDIAQAAKKLAASKRSPDLRLNDDVCKALRTLYFTPNGVLRLLKQIESGDAVPPERLSRQLVEFNDREWKVQAALESIDFDRLIRELRLTLATTRGLRLIFDAKKRTRRILQEEINYYGQKNVRPNRRKLRSLIGLIEKLNSEIEDVERVVNLRAQER